MTERTILKQTREFEDDISITSTQSEQYSSDQEFLVKRILAEKKGSDGKMYYLVFWATYPEEDSTWEPKKNIQDPDILQIWKERKDQEDRGLKPTFNIARFEARIHELALAKTERRRRRKNKRKSLGISVSPEPEERHRADDSDSTEAVESDGAPKDDRGMGRKGKALQKTKKPSRPDLVPPDSSGGEASATRRRTNVQKDENQSDGAATSDDSLIGDLQRMMDEKRSKKKALQIMREKRVAQRPSKLSTGQGKTVSKKAPENSASFRPQSSSSPDVLLTGVTGQRKQSQQHSESTDLAVFREVASTSEASPNLNFTINLSENASTSRRQPVVRGSSAVGRGRGATRGGSYLAPRNVFASRPPSKKRPTIIDNAGDASKTPKHFNSMRMRRKAQLAGRDVAERAPDVAALGGLYAPSDPSTFRSLKSMRKASSVSNQQDRKLDGQMDIDDLLVSQSSQPNSKGADAWDPTPGLNLVHQHHSPQSEMPPRPQWQERHGYNAICHFWNLKGSCNKGYQCSFKHNDDINLPIGPPPPGHSSRYSPPAHTLTKEQTSLISPPSLRNSPPAPTIPSSRPLWDRPESWPEHLKTVCFFWHTRGTCTKGEKCGYFHTYEGDLPIAPDPNHGDRHGDRPPVSTQLPQFGPGPALPPSRPPGDRHNPFHAICYYWHTWGTCKKGDHCKYLHTDDINIPVAPGPNPRNETCKYWAAGYCEKPAAKCQYRHGYPEPQENVSEHPDSRQQPELLVPSMVTSDGAATIPTGQRKSVSFAVDGSTAFSNEPESGIINHNTGPPNKSSRDPKYGRAYTTWEQGSFVRDDKSLYWRSYDGSDEQIVESPAVQQPTREGHREEGTAFQMEPQSVEQNFLHHSPAGFQSTSGGSGFFHPERLGLLQADGINVDTRFEAQTSSSQIGVLNYGVQAQLETQKETTGSTKPLNIPTKSNTTNASSTFSEKPNAASPKLKRAKISMDNYRRNKTNKTLGDRAKEVAFGKEESNFVFADFGDLTQAKQHAWGQSFAALTQIHFTQICLAQDFQGQVGSLLHQKLWQGSLGPDSTDQEALKTMERAWEHLRLSSAGFVSLCIDFVVLLYPAIEEWRFIEVNESFSPEMRLRYLVFQSNLDFNTTPHTGLTSNPTNYRTHLVEAIHGLNFKLFVPKFRKGQLYHFYLLFPPTSNKTADFMTTWLRACSDQIKIYSSQTEGSWDFFVKDPKIGIGCVLIHESAVASICELPSLRALFGSNKAFTFWYIAEGAAEYPMYGPPQGSSPGQITATRLLPHGHAFFLTPSFLIAEPDRAFRIIRWFMKDKSKNSTPGTWKLVCAHNIRQYLLDVAIDKSAEKDALETKYQGDPRKDAIVEEQGLSYPTCKIRFQLYELVDELLCQNMTEKHSDYDSDIPDESISSMVYASEFVDPDDEQSLVTWFAGWAMCKLDQFRKFTVVGSSTKYEKRAVRRKKISPCVDLPQWGKQVRPGSSQPRKSPKHESSPANDQSNPGSPKPARRILHHTALSSVERSNTVSTPAKAPERHASISETYLNVGEIRALENAARYNSDTPHSPLPGSKAKEGNSSDITLLSKSQSSPTTAFPPQARCSQVKRVGILSDHSDGRLRQGEILGTQVSPPTDPDTETSVQTTHCVENHEPATVSQDGITDQLPSKGLQFTAIMEGNFETANNFLVRADDNLQTSVRLHAAQAGGLSQLGGVDDSMDMDEQDSKAIELHGNKPAAEPFSLGFNNGSTSSPPQLDGPGDGRPKCLAADCSNSSRSGTETDENGRRTVPSSTCPSGTLGPEVAIKPAYAPCENQEGDCKLRHRVIDNQSEICSQSASKQDSLGVSNPAREKNVDAMDVDSPSVEAGQERCDGGAGVEFLMKEIKYEATTTWYSRWYKNGKGWEHIYVDSSDKAFKYLGVR